MNTYGILAIHGGLIEPGTSAVAHGIAGSEFPIFVNESGGHTPSNAFKSKECDAFLKNVTTAISIHGEKDGEFPFVMIGGLDTQLGATIGARLESAGFETRTPPAGLDGDDPHNVCNRCASGRGVQLEISRKLRDQLMDDAKLMEKFCGAVRECLQ